MAAFPSRGEIYLVTFPDDGMERPAVIISINARNERANSVLGVPLTTNLRPAPTHVFIAMGEGGVRHESMARCENIALLRKDRLANSPLGPALPTERIKQIENAVQRAIGIPVP